MEVVDDNLSHLEGSSQDEVVLEEVVEVLLKLEEHMLHVDLHNHSNLVLVVDWNDSILKFRQKTEN